VKKFLLLPLLCLCRICIADDIDDYVKSQMQALKIPAVAFAIVKNGQVVRKEAIGLADIESKREVKVDDLFEIASLTKQFTAMGMLILAENGRIELEDSITKYLPDAPPQWASIKLRHLLYQTSGLPEYGSIPGLGMMDNFTRAEFIDKMSKQPIDFEPGVAWAYSNTNYALLGWIIEEIAKEPYTKFIEETVLGPVGMTHTSFTEHGVEPTGIAKGYLHRRRGPVPIPRGPASIKSDSGLVSNLPDMIKWDEALANLRLLKKKSYQLLWGRAKLNSGRVRSYGMGWYLNIPGTGAYIGHGGNSSGFSSGFSRFPNIRLSVILMANLNPVAAESMTREIAAIYDPTLKPTPFQELPDPETYAPMKTARAKMAGPGLWEEVKTIDKIAFGGLRQQGTDTLISYRITAGPRVYNTLILWSNLDKLAQATIYPE